MRALGNAARSGARAGEAHDVAAAPRAGEEASCRSATMSRASIRPAASPSWSTPATSARLRACSDSTRSSTVPSATSRTIVTGRV